MHGIDPKFGPLAYTKTPEFPSLGIPDASEDITGGMGFEGLLNLDRFVRGGGVLIALGDAGTLPVDGGHRAQRLPARGGASTRRARSCGPRWCGRSIRWSTATRS